MPKARFASPDDAYRLVGLIAQAGQIVASAEASAEREEAEATKQA